MRLLVKYECIECDEQFLVDKARAEGKELICPYCTEETEAVAGQNPDPDVDLGSQLDGCLWPSGPE